MSLLFGIGIVGFSFYVHFLVDYSLESLEMALTTTEENPIETSVAEHKVQQSVIHDLIIEEASKEKSEVKNLALLETAYRSFKEPFQRAGFDRAKVYLNQVTQIKKAPDETLGGLRNRWNQLIIRFRALMKSLDVYIRRKVSQPKVSIEGSGNFAALFLLNQAEVKGTEGDYPGAAAIYRKYLKLYPSGRDEGFVTISLAENLLRQRKFDEAKQILQQVKVDFSGEQEADLAARWLRKIEDILKREKIIQELKQELQGLLSTKEADLVRFKLALAYLSVERFEEAENLLKPLSESQKFEDSNKAKFLMAWLFKKKAKYKEGEEILRGLLEDPMIGEEMELGLHAQLADIYLQSGDIRKSISEYDVLSKKAAKAGGGKSKVAREAWSSLAEIEQANLYFFDLNDPIKAKEHLNRMELSFRGFDARTLERRFNEASGINLRDYAFQALKRKHVNLAFELFQKHLANHPKDAWTHAGLATVYLLFGDSEKGLTYARRGHELGADEYTSSVLAYTLDLSGDSPKAIELYQKAITQKPEYIPARFNLSYIYLRSKSYEQALELLEALESEMEGGKSFAKTKILNNIGLAYWGLGQEEKAVKKFKEALEINAGFSSAKRNLDHATEGKSVQPAGDAR